MAQPGDTKDRKPKHPKAEAKTESDSPAIDLPEKPQVRVTEKEARGSKQPAQAAAKTEGDDLKAEAKLDVDIEQVKTGKVSPPKIKVQAEPLKEEGKPKPDSPPEPKIETPAAPLASKPIQSKVEHHEGEAEQVEERTAEDAPVLQKAAEAVRSRPVAVAVAKSDPMPQVGKAGLYGSETIRQETRDEEQAPRPGRMEIEKERREKHKRHSDTAAEMVRGQAKRQAKSAARKGLRVAGKAAKRVGSWALRGIIGTAPIWIPLLFIVILVVWFAIALTAICSNGEGDMTPAQKDFCASYGDTNKSARQRYYGGQMTQSDRAVGAPVLPELTGGYYQNQATVDAAANRHKVGTDVIAAVATVESGLNGSWNRHAESDKGALGVMQILPSTWEQYGCEGDQYSASDSIDCGAKILADLQAKVGEIELCQSRTIECMAAAYNGGLGALEDSAHCEGEMKWECAWDDSDHTVANTGYRETRDYVDKVQITRASFKALVVQ